ncbi:MAG: hypothetical protein U5L11_08295 [Arhodomonas sp.]|nr:hypothetical protein [Arhodomonas sp.]
MLGDLAEAVARRIVLVVVVVIADVGRLQAVLVGLAIPGSFLAGILAVSPASAYTLNIVVLFSLILVVARAGRRRHRRRRARRPRLARRLRRGDGLRQRRQRMAWPISQPRHRHHAWLRAPPLFWPGAGRRVHEVSADHRAGHPRPPRWSWRWCFMPGARRRHRPAGDRQRAPTAVRPLGAPPRRGDLRASGGFARRLRALARACCSTIRHRRFCR